MMSLVPLQACNLNVMDCRKPRRGAPYIAPPATLMERDKVSVSKRLRFEIFKRDGFACRYCGSHPPDVLLEVDHIHPLAAGGGSDEMNLVTSCVDCNRGKSDKLLGNVRPRPDADLAYLEVVQESAELKRYLISKQEKKELQLAVIVLISEAADLHLPNGYSLSEDQILRWLDRYSPEEIEFGIMRAGIKFKVSQMSYAGIVPYASAVMRENRIGTYR